MKKFIIFTVLIFMSVQSVLAIEADDSVDEIIKKQYNALDGDKLPKLPKTSPKSVESKNFLDIGTGVDNNNTKPSESSSSGALVDNIPRIPQKTSTRSFKVNSWRKVNAKLLTPVSSSSKEGKQISFVTVEPLYSKSFEIPKGTKITGTVVKTHAPQFLGNGGLVSMKTETISYRGNISYFEGNIVNLSHKHVFFNNIKGHSGYAKGVSKAMKPGKNFYKKSLNVTKKVLNSPFAILSPVVYLPGAVFLLADGAVSPFIAIFSKGERVYIPKDTQVTIKLTSPAHIEY